MWAARSLFCSSGFAHVEQPAIGRQLFLCLQGRELWPSDKKARPSPSPLTLFHSVSTLVFCFVCWLGRLPITVPRQTFARLRVERTVTACTVELNKAHALSSLLTAQNRLADKRPHGATRRQCSQSGCVFGRAMWDKALKADSHLIFAVLLCSRLCFSMKEHGHPVHFHLIK